MRNNQELYKEGQRGDYLLLGKFVNLGVYFSLLCKRSEKEDTYPWVVEEVQV